MKKNVFLVLLALTTMRVIGGSDTEVRNKCNFLTNRFVATAHISLAYTVPLCKQRGVGCGYADAYCGNYGGCGAYATAHAGYDYVSHYTNECGGYTGALYSPLVTDFNSSLKSSTSNTPVNVKPSSLRVGYKPIFTNDSILIKNINIVLKASKKSNLENSVIFTIWQPQDDSINQIRDTIITNEKILTSASLVLKNGQFEVNGNFFDKNDFIINESTDSVYVTFIGKNKSICTSKLKSQDFAISTSTDIKASESEMIQNALSESILVEKESGISISPNVLQNTSVLFVNSALNQSVKLSVYNSLGQTIQTSNESLQMGSNQIEIQNITFGVYFIIIKTNKGSIMRKIIKE